MTGKERKNINKKKERKKEKERNKEKEREEDKTKKNKEKNRPVIKIVEEVQKTLRRYKNILFNRQLPHFLLLGQSLTQWSRLPQT